MLGTVGNNYNQVIIESFAKENPFGESFPSMEAQMLDTLPSPPNTQPHPSLLLLQPPTCPNQGLAKQMEQFSPFFSSSLLFCGCCNEKLFKRSPLLPEVCLAVGKNSAHVSFCQVTSCHLSLWRKGNILSIVLGSCGRASQEKSLVLDLSRCSLGHQLREQCHL